MLWAVDLHVHSRFAEKVSPAMTLENIAWWAQRKGLDLLGTGDCLQPQWLAEIEANTIEAEPGLLALKPELERAVHARLPAHLRRALRFVLSTEVNCAPPGTREIAGLHQLLYFPSLKVAREFAARLAKAGKGDLQAGRPTLALSARDLVRGARDFERVHVAAPHAMNPWFSVLGVIAGADTLEGIYRDELPNLWAVETGLSSDPAMCRRVPGLDRLGLFACSDAHSLEKLGREYTLLDIAPGYDELMAALRAGTRDRIKGLVKIPLPTSHYYFNCCSGCQAPFDAWPACPKCGRRLTMGSRDHLERIPLVRRAPVFPPDAPPFEALLPLASIIGRSQGTSPDGTGVRRVAAGIIDQVGSERYILIEASPPELLRATTPEIAQAIVNQRKGPISKPPEGGPARFGQGRLDL